MQNVLKRLATSESVPESEILALKEIKEANSCISNSRPTIELQNRAGIQQGVFERLQKMGSAVIRDDGSVSFSGEINRERRMDIVIGLPASGKSSAVVEPLSEYYKSRVVDSDEAKKLLPEFNEGWGAGVVHKESQLISDKQLWTAIRNGENITYPRVGSDYDELVNIVAAAKKHGYSVYVHYNELDRNKALGRLINRFLETGRYIKPELITRYSSGISNTYEQIKKATSLIDGFSKWSNDVPIGCRPKLMEYSGSCADMVQAFNSTVRDRLQVAETNCKVLRAKIDEVNDVLRNNPELSREYVKSVMNSEGVKVLRTMHRYRLLRNTRNENCAIYSTKAALAVIANTADMLKQLNKLKFLSSFLFW